MPRKHRFGDEGLPPDLAEESGLTTDGADVREFRTRTTDNNGQGGARGSGGNPNIRAVGDESEFEPVARLLGDALKGAPIPKTIVVPEGYDVDDSGDYLVKVEVDRDGSLTRERETITRAPVVLTMQLVDSVTGDPSYVVVYKRGDGGEWRSLVAGSETLRTTRLLNTLAKPGVPIISNRAAKLSAFLDALATRNHITMPRGTSSWRFGHHGEGEEAGYLYGGTYLCKGYKPVRLDDAESYAQMLPPGLVVYSPRSDSPGDRQMASAYSTGGTREGWRGFVKVAPKYDTLMLLIYAALTAPLLRIIADDVANILVDLSYETSAGKTTVLRVLASIYGYAGRGSVSLIKTFRSTRNWLEQATLIQQDLPTFIDETMRGNPDDVSGFVYDFANAESRGRGTKEGGIQESSTSRGVVVTTGEQRITTIGPRHEGGAHARAIEIVGMPFDEKTDETRDVVNGLNAGAVEHFGHAGREWIQHLLENQHRWDEWRDLYKTTRAAYQADPTKGGGDNPVAARLADSLAVIDTAARIIGETDILPWDYADPCTPFWNRIRAGAREADKAELARRDLWDWCWSNETHFYGRHRSDQNANPMSPPGPDGFVGYWDDEDDWEWIGFKKRPLQAILARLGYSGDIVGRFADRGWLIESKDPKHPGQLQRTIDVRGQKSRAWLTCVSREALTDLVDGSGDSRYSGPRESHVPS